MELGNKNKDYNQDISASATPIMTIPFLIPLANPLAFYQSLH